MWAGTDAIGIGLVDELGGLEDAINYAASMASLDTYRLVEYPEVLPMMDRLLASVNETGAGTEQDVKTVADAFSFAGNWLLNLDGPTVVSRMPYFEIILK